MKPPVVLFIVASTLVIAAPALAKGVVCEHVQDDSFDVDGMVDDWQSFAATSYGSGRDAKLEVRCAHDETKLYFLVEATDERLVRSRKANPKKEDRIAIELRVGRAKAMKFSLLPGSLRAARKDLNVPGYVELEDSLQDDGFSVELAIPLRKLKDWADSVPYLKAKILFHDVDKASDGRAQGVVGLKGKLHFSDAVSTYQSFMRTVGLKNRDVKLDRLVDVDPGTGPERVIVGGKVIGVLGKSFTYLGLPIAHAKDLLRCRVVDFDGSGRYGILTELRQYGNGGSRDIVIVWFAKGDGGFEAALSFETRKELGGASIVNAWSLVPRGKHREMDAKRRKRGGRYKAPPGSDLLVLVGEVKGFDENTYREAPPPDAKAILTPWGDQQSAVHYFDGTVAYGGAAGIDLPEK